MRGFNLYNTAQYTQVKELTWYDPQAHKDDLEYGGGHGGGIMERTKGAHVVVEGHHQQVENLHQDAAHTHSFDGQFDAKAQRDAIHSW